MGKGGYKNSDIISLKQLAAQDITDLFKVIENFKDLSRNNVLFSPLAGRVVTLLFYEPSSRTRGSFDAAVKKLGGDTILVENPQVFSSVSKGETFEDTIRVFESYSDLIVLRHPERGMAKKAAKIAKIPIINAGDGIGEHPTQALLDLFTIWEKKHTLSGLRGVIAGDILNGRTVHSLLTGLSYFEKNEIYLLAPDELKISKTDLKELSGKIKIHEIATIDEIPPDCDFWYWTRVQKERFKSEELYKKVNNKFIVTRKILNKYADKNTILLHPLPRVGEITEDVDSDPRALYLTDQVKNGLYVRMALLSSIIGNGK